MNNMIFILASKNFFWDKVRELFVTLDSMAFYLFSKVMGLMFDIANLTTEKAGKLEEFFDPFYRRVYVILSIYMLFKVTVSILTYVVNPDAMTDKNQGAGKLVQRIIVSLMILMFFPTGFTILNDLQRDIIANNTIPNLVLGVGGSVSNPEDIGRDISYKIYNGTFVYVSGESGTPATTDEESVSAIVDVINDSGANDGVYKYDYIIFVGFATGILLTILTLSMCIDVSVRVFKLIILELVAPIPIISYMDPKQAKDGAFSKWLKLTIKTWADIFIRLFVIYFIVLVIEQVIQGGGALVDDTKPFVKIALIIGLLFFAKDAPKFICEAIGIKDVPKGGLFGGLGAIMSAGAIGAIGAGTISGAISGYSASKLADEANFKQPNKIKNLGAGLFGAVGGLATGIGAATKAKDHNARAVMEAMSRRNDAAIAAGAAGSTALGRAKSMGSRILTGQTLAMKGERAISKMQSQKDALSNVKSRMSGEMVKKDWTTGSLGLKSAYGDGDIMANYKTFMAAKDAAANQGLDYVEFKDSKGRDQIISMEEANMQYGFLLKNNEDDYLQNGVAHGDTTLGSLIDIANKALDGSGITVTDRSSVTDTIDNLGINITRAKSANETNKQNDRFAGKK